MRPPDRERIGDMNPISRFFEALQKLANGEINRPRESSLNDSRPKNQPSDFFHRNEKDGGKEGKGR